MAERFAVKWAPTALDDLDGILACLAEQAGHETAERVGRALLTRADSLERRPRRCRVVPQLEAIGVTDYRELIVRPYRMIFRIDGRVAGIVAVLDARRDLEELLVRRLVR